jgi:predicted CXXCH cytochrome family protein
MNPRYATIARCLLAVAAGAAAGSVLWAQSAPTGTPPPETQPASQPAAQPAEGYPYGPRNAVPPEDAAVRSAREQLTSGLIGSKHDFTHGGERGRALCLPCHTPHLVGAPVPRLDQRATTTQPLRPYQTLGVALTGWSLLCLGCHDGVTARDVYSSAHAINVADQLGNSRLGTRGLRSHPVGIRYPFAAEGYAAAAEVEAGGLLLEGGTLQCTTCHDTHNTRRYPGMLRISNEHSRLCLTCHRL